MIHLNQIDNIKYTTSLDIIQIENDFASFVSVFIV